MEGAITAVPYSSEHPMPRKKGSPAGSIIDFHVHPTDYQQLKDYVSRNKIERAVILASGTELYPEVTNALVIELGRKDPCLIPAGTFNPKNQESPPLTSILKFYPAYQQWNPSEYVSRIHALPQKVLIFHTGAKGAGVEYVVQFSKPWMLEPVVKGCPDKTIIAAHAGFPWIDDMAALVDKYDNIYVDIAPLNKPLERVRDSIPVDRILYGSDWPLGISSVQRVRDVFMEDAEKVLRENALTVLSRRDR